MSGSKQTMVHRSYWPEPDHCTRVLALLLEKTVRKTAAEHTPEPDGRNDAAIVRYTKEVSHVEQRHDRSSQIT